jgi:hypothetical protein
MSRRTLSVLALAAAVGLVATLLMAPAASARPRAFTAKLTGEKEVPGPGDANATGSALVRTNWQKGKVCFGLLWRGLGPVVAAHIHVGGADVAGDVKVPLFQLNEPLPRHIRAISGCVRNVPKKLIGRINRGPKGYYVNVHTTGYPDGAIRGQLRPA